VMDTGFNGYEIFNPFFTTKEKWIGLGLVITREILVNHNGNIEVMNQNRKRLHL